MVEIDELLGAATEEIAKSYLRQLPEAQTVEDVGNNGEKAQELAGSYVKENQARLEAKFAELLKQIPKNIEPDLIEFEAYQSFIAWIKDEAKTLKINATKQTSQTPEESRIEESRDRVDKSDVSDGKKGGGGTPVLPYYVLQEAPVLQKKPKRSHTISLRIPDDLKDQLDKLGDMSGFIRDAIREKFQREGGPISTLDALSVVRKIEELNERKIELSKALNIQEKGYLVNWEQVVEWRIMNLNDDLKVTNINGRYQVTANYGEYIGDYKIKEFDSLLAKLGFEKKHWIKIDNSEVFNISKNELSYFIKDLQKREINIKLINQIKNEIEEINKKLAELGVPTPQCNT